MLPSYEAMGKGKNGCGEPIKDLAWKSGTTKPGNPKPPREMENLYGSMRPLRASAPFFSGNGWTSSSAIAFFIPEKWHLTKHAIQTKEYEDEDGFLRRGKALRGWGRKSIVSSSKWMKSIFVIR